MNDRRRQIMGTIGTIGGGTSKVWNGFKEINFSDLESLGNYMYIWRGTLTCAVMGFTITNPIVVIYVDNTININACTTGSKSAVYWAYYNESGNNIGRVSLGQSDGVLAGYYLKGMVENITTDISSVYGINTTAQGLNGYWYDLSLSELQFINSSTTAS